MNRPQSAALFFPEIKELLNQKDYALLKDVLKECSIIDFADVWKRFNENERLQLFKIIPASSALKLFEILDIEDQRYLLNKLGDENTVTAGDSVTPILEGMDSPDLAKIFNKMSPRAVKKMTSLIKRQDCLAHVDYLMKFPEHSAGSLMHPEFVKLSPRMTSKQALLRLQAIARPGQKEHLYTLFVVDENGKPMGLLSVQDLIAAPEDQKLTEIMLSTDGIRILPEMDQEAVAQLFSKYDLNAAPVVDVEGNMIGVLTMKDMISIVRQEATEDITKMAGAKASDLIENSVFKVAWGRMPWLVLTLFGGILLSFIIKHFEPILSQIIALASFSPLIAGMGGNVGSQSATIVVRSIALGQINGHSKVKTVIREMCVGLVLGVVYGILLGGVAYIIYGAQYGVDFSIVVAIGMCTSMTVAATLGLVGPIVFHRMGVDPATATGPLITTLTDIVTTLTYFSLAAWLLFS